MSKWLYFHASAIDSSSVISHDTGTNIDFGAFPTKNLTSIMAEEDHVYLYFKSATRFETGIGGNSNDEDTYETMEQVYVRLTVGEGKEHTVVSDLLGIITKSNVGVIKFDAVGSNWPIANVTAIQIRRHLTTHTIASD
tara:strand:+ start:25 stop:438 length:414 start_codon:yes stop_codon:yes gene_type:complete